MSAPAPDHEVAIIGAGFAGIGTATALERAGIDDYVLLEQGDGVGGTWHWNTYPGVGVDIPSFSYQFSYAQRSDWSRVYAPGRELKAYAEDCVDSFGLRSRIRLGTEVVAARFDAAGQLWRLEIGDGSTLTARFLVAATGVFNKPKPPEIEGLDSFDGPVLHTGRWDPEVELRGKRVAIIGTGASAVQVIPAIAPEVERLTVFQRTPIWCLPKFDRKLAPGLRRAIERIPGAKPLARGLSQAFVELNFPLPAHFAGVVPVAGAAERLGHKHLRQQVRDPELRRKLTPQYGLGCKRPSFSNTYLSTFNRPNVALETDPISAIGPSGLETAEARLHEADVLILATGFKVFDPDNMPPIPISGRDGTDLGA